MNKLQTTELAINSVRNPKSKAIDSSKSIDSEEINFIRNFKEIISKKLNGGCINLYEELQQFEKEMICIALIKSAGNQRTAAKLLGMKPTTINVKIKRYKIRCSLTFNQE